MGMSVSAQTFANLYSIPQGATRHSYAYNNSNYTTKPKKLKLQSDYRMNNSIHNLASISSHPVKNKLFIKEYDIQPLPYKVNNMPDEENILDYELMDGTTWREDEKINMARLLPVAAIVMSLDLSLYFYQRKVWDQNNTTKIHSINWWIDIHGYQRMDKLGHFTDAYFVSDLTSKFYRWSGFSGTQSIWMGAATGWLWMLQIEISDGFFADWGFSWLDLSANTLGSGFFVLQQYFPEILGGLHPKFSYHVSPAWKQGIYTKNPKAFIEDYEGMTFWLAINPHHYFPNSWKKGFPKWLAPFGIAIGYGAEGIAQAPQFGRPKWYIGLDIDLRKLPIGNDNGLVKFIKSELNFLRLPLPTIRISPSGIWYGFYF